jgi:hypothetical protein
MQDASAGDAVADFAGGGVGEGFGEALAAQEEESVTDFEFGVVEAFASGDFADMGGAAGDELILVHGTVVEVRNLSALTVNKFFIGPYTTLGFADFDGLPGDELYYLNGNTFSIAKPR